MQVTGHIPELRSIIRGYKQNGKKVSFVPTMGALHDGHLSLIRLARKNSDEVVVSIYVNPKQFAPNEDFATYPTTLEQDLSFCKQEGVSLVFTPDTQGMYNEELFFSLEVHTLNQYLDGASRKGYFQGIALVVNKLFNIVEPDLDLFVQEKNKKERMKNIIFVHYDSPFADRDFLNAVKHDKLPTLVSKEMFYLSNSEYEGFGMSIIEAMSLGLVPVIIATGEAMSYCKYNLN